MNEQNETTTIGPVMPELTEITVTLAKPTVTDTCFNGQCRHTFGLHYITFDNRRSGCSATKSGPRGGNEQSCPCDGYVLMPPQPYHRGRR